MSSLPGKDPSLVDATSFGAAGSSSRRRFLQAVGLGGVAASAPLAAVTANASPVVIPRRPTDADTGLLVFAQSLELAIFGAYDIVVNRLTGGSLTMPEPVVPVMHALREHHLAYSQSLAALLGRTAPGLANATLMASITKTFSGATSDEILAAAADLENTATATHGSLVAVLVGIDGSALISSIMAMEARHATTLAAIAGRADLPGAGLEDLSAALSPDDFPVV